jgi:hypothetical protein
MLKPDTFLNSGFKGPLGLKTERNATNGRFRNAIRSTMLMS